MLNQIRHFWRTLLFFTIWGMALGLIAGLFVGLPYIHLFTFHLIVAWGLVLSTGLGILTSIILFCSRAHLIRRRREVAWLVGLFNAATALTLTIIATYQVWWRFTDLPLHSGYSEPTLRLMNVDREPLLISISLPLLLLSAVACSGLITAYNTHRYFGWLDHLSNSDTASSKDDRWQLNGDFSRLLWWSGHFFEHAWWLLLPIGVFFTYLSGGLYSFISLIVIAFNVISVMALLVLGSGMLMVALDRLVFRHLLERLSLERYQHWIVAICIGFTLLVWLTLAYQHIFRMSSTSYQSFGYELRWIRAFIMQGLALVSSVMAAHCAHAFAAWRYEDQDEEDAADAVYNQQQKAKPKRQSEDGSQAALLENLFDGAHLAEEINAADRK